VSWYGLPFFLINIAKWASLKSPELTVSLSIVMVWVWAMSFVLRLTTSVTLAGNGIIAGLCWHFLFLLYRTGGMDSASMSWTLVIPLFAMMLVTRLQALIWTVVSGGGIVILFILKLSGYVFPLVSLTGSDLLKEQITNALGPFLATFILGILLLQGIRQAVKEQQEGVLAQRKADDLESLFQQVQRSGIQVTSSSAELAATASQQETMLVNQVSSMNLMVMAVEEIATVATELGQTVQDVAALSQGMAEFASSGQTDLARMEEAMERMASASKAVSNRLGAINEKTENITSVVTTINKVADQTNLLSLNAAIEAEKAGEYGRGFTVVAREIRRLADQTATATLDIAQMVKEMQSAVAAGVMEMDKFIAEVRQSAGDVEKISTQLARIIEQVQIVSPRFEEVNVAMGGQVERAREIQEQMMHLSQELHQTTESLQESFRAIEQLNEASKALQTEVSRFQAVSSGEEGKPLRATS
jgi:methyl-accepting chemotaxis protein